MNIDWIDLAICVPVCACCCAFIDYLRHRWNSRKTKWTDHT